MRFLIIPIYKSGVMLRLKFHKLALPTRGIALFFVSNRYLFHIVLGAASIATLAANFQTYQAQAQDVGKESLLYILATNSEVEIVQETAREDFPKTVYQSADAIAAIPHIDFDYEDTADQVVSLSIPGTIGAEIAPDVDGGSKAPRTKTEIYAVENGDTIASIARKFGVNVGTLLWSNNLSARQYIKPGDELKIPPVSGILVTIKKGDTIAKLAKRYNANESEIKDFNKIIDETTLAVGTEIMVPGGYPTEPEQTMLAISGKAREEISAAGRAGIKKPADVNTEKLAKAQLLWPTTGRVITQYYGWRHTGVDIDGDFTSPLYAAYEGVVNTAGWNTGGYGLHILVQHSNGITTRYAHASKLFVKVGDHVSRGEVIAMMGSTGRSTGSHLHFEVYINGKRVNPLKYVK